MKRKVQIVIAAAFMITLIPTEAAHAQGQPIQLALFNPIQIVPEGQAISGIRLNLIYGKNTSVTGVDFGLVNHTTSGHSQGLQFGFVGYNEADFTGWMEHAVNITQGKDTGVQFGIFNHARRMEGVQIGLVNHAESLHGLQIGLVNVIDSGGAFPVLPIVNWSF